MKTQKLLIPVGMVVCLACVAFAQKSEPDSVAPATQKDEQPAKSKHPLEDFMRKKLDASSKILEGLCDEDSELVKEGVGELREMSKIAAWNVLTDAKYREHSRTFRDNATLVADAAQEGDFRKAALRWFDVTTSCMDCHDHVRKERKPEK